MPFRSLEYAEPRRSGRDREERERVRSVYARRVQTVPVGRYARVDPAVLCAIAEREQAMAALFRSAGLTSLANLRILEVGCGRGSMLRHLLNYEAQPTHLFGLDLREDQIHEAHRLGPHLQFTCADAANLPFRSESFDLILQFTVFTSVLSDVIKSRMAAEFLRVLVPGGKVLWYDFVFNNPRNHDVRGIGSAEIRGLFPRCSFHFHRVTVLPPLARYVARISPVFYHFLAALRILSTHYLCLLEKECP
jgi:ubiquinone/menaquinone biosynthesis C-methylase UbiE